MGLSSVLDVAIGLIFMYLILSLICTTVNELIATVLKLRARNLSKTITALIDDKDLRKAFYDHGLVSNSTVASRAGAREAKAGQTDEVGSAVKGAQSDAAGRARDQDHPSYLDPRSVAMALLDSLDPEHRQNPAQQKTFPSVSDIQQSVEKLPDSNIRDVLLASLSTSQGEITRLRDGLAAWFDTAMDRLSGHYKRQIKWMSLVIGILVAGALNADSLAVGRALWRDGTLRGQMVGSAAQIVESLAAERAGGPSPSDNAAPLNNAVPPTPAPVPAGAPPPDGVAPPDDAAAPAAAPPPVPAGDTGDEAVGDTAQSAAEVDREDGSDEVDEKIVDLTNRIAQQQALLRPLPIGWPDQQSAASSGSFLWFPLKVLGLLWTGLALSLGAPFWFDLLQKFMNVRGAGMKPEEKR